MLLALPDNDTPEDPDPVDPAPALPVPQEQPAPRREAALAFGLGGNADLTYVARRLGQGSRSVRWLRRYLDALIAGDGFPKPFPLPSGDGLSHAVAAGSRWRRDAVDAWLDGQVEGAVANVVNAAEHAAAQARLAASAGTLRERIRLVAGGRA